MTGQAFLLLPGLGSQPCRLLLLLPTAANFSLFVGDICSVCDHGSNLLNTNQLAAILAVREVPY